MNRLQYKPNMRARHLSQVFLLQTLSHPYIVAYRDSFLIEGACDSAMELIAVWHTQVESCRDKAAEANTLVIVMEPAFSALFTELNCILCHCAKPRYCGGGDIRKAIKDDSDLVLRELASSHVHNFNLRYHPVLEGEN